MISEAREAGCAIVASDVDGIPEMLEGGRAGIIVPSRSPGAIAAAVLRVIASNESLALWRSRSQINLEKLTIARTAAETMAVYRGCRAGLDQEKDTCAADAAQPSGLAPPVHAQAAYPPTLVHRFEGPEEG